MGLCHMSHWDSHKGNWKWPTLPNCFTVNEFNRKKRRSYVFESFDETGSTSGDDRKSKMSPKNRHIRFSRKNDFVGHVMATFNSITIYFTKNRLVFVKTGYVFGNPIKHQFFLHHRKEQLKLYKMSKSQYCYDFFLKITAVGG